jgi:phage shock protein E
MKLTGILILIGLLVAVLAGAQQRLSSQELEKLLNLEEAILIDVRTADEFATGAIPGALNIPYDELAGNLPTTNRDEQIVVYCRSGRRSGIARKTLESLGFKNVLDFGGIDRWEGELEIPQ